MNTLIHLWIEPLVMNHERCNEIIYFNQIINGDYSGLKTEELDELIQREHIQDVMDYADIDRNWNFGVLWAKTTSKPVSITRVDSPKEKKEKATVKKINKEIQRIVTNKTVLPFDARNMDIQDGGKINVSVPALRINDTIDFAKIWNSLEDNFIGKIQEGDHVVLTDDDGNKIFEIHGGSFLNVGGMGSTDMSIRGKNGDLKGGLYLRDDGRLDIGDYERTFHLQIYTNNLLKASVKLNKSLMDITSQKLLTDKIEKQK